MTENLLQIDHLTKRFQTRDGEVTALDNISLAVGRGEFVSIQGASGCGKSTLMLTIGGMLQPTLGVVRMGGRDIVQLSSRERTTFRRKQIGFVFQMFHLVPYLSILDNVLVGTHFQGTRSEIVELLTTLGLQERLRHKPNQLSTGERQRTALARALINNPPLILADEPTGNLDPENACEVFRILSQYRDTGGTVLVVSHGEMAAQWADRTVWLKSGKLLDSPTLEDISTNSDISQ